MNAMRIQAEMEQARNEANGGINPGLNTNLNQPQLKTRKLADMDKEMKTAPQQQSAPGGIKPAIKKGYAFGAKKKQ